MASSVNENKIISKVMQNCYKDLVQDLNSKSLVDYLFQEFWLSDEEKNEIQAISIRQQQNRKLLNIITTKDDEALDVMMKHLQTEKSQKHLYDLLVESKNKITSQEIGLAEAERKEMRILPSKWWPEEKPLINSFIERKTKSGQLIVDAIHKELQSNQNKSTAIISKNKQSIVGMGGIGKTTIAKWYANKYQHEYTHIIWIDSDGSSLLKSIQKLAKKLNPSWQQEGRYYGNQCIKDLLEEVYTKLELITCLFVFDNAETYDCRNGLSKILPKNILHYSVITSRCQEWGNACEFQLSVLQIDVFTKEESTTFLNKTLGKGSPGIEELGKELGYLPLALQVAVATINKRTKFKSYTILSYLNRIRNDIRILMEQRVLNEYERSISASLQLSIEQIEDNEDIDLSCRNLCKSILHVAAYCLPDKIPIKLIEAIPNADEYVVEDAIEQLLIYSLISTPNSKPDALSIHRLLQIALRNKIQLCPNTMAETLRVVFVCMESDLCRYEKHAFNAWVIALQYDIRSVLKPHSGFGIKLLTRAIGSTKYDIIEPTLASFRNVLPATDVEIVLLEMIHVYHKVKKWESVCASDNAVTRLVAEGLIQTLVNSCNVAPARNQLIMHAKLLLEFVIFHSNYISGNTLKCTLEVYKNVLGQLESFDDYNGVINGYHVPYCMLNIIIPNCILPFRIAVLFDYAHLLCLTQQDKLAQQVLWEYYDTRIPDNFTKLCFLCNLYKFICAHERHFYLDLFNESVSKCFDYAKQCFEAHISKNDNTDQAMFDDIDTCKIFSDICWGHLKILLQAEKLKLAEEAHKYILSNRKWKGSFEDGTHYMHFYSAHHVFKKFIDDVKLKEAYHLCQIIWDSWTSALRQSSSASEVKAKKFGMFFSVHSYYTQELISRRKFEEALQLEKLMSQFLLAIPLTGHNLVRFLLQLDQIQPNSFVTYEQFVASIDVAALQEIYRLKLNNVLEVIGKVGGPDIHSNFICIGLVKIYLAAIYFYTIFYEFESVITQSEILIKNVVKHEIHLTTTSTSLGLPVAPNILRSSLGFGLLGVHNTLTNIAIGRKTMLQGGPFSYCLERIDKIIFPILEFLGEQIIVYDILEIISEGVCRTLLNQQRFSTNHAVHRLISRFPVLLDLIINEAITFIDCNEILKSIYVVKGIITMKEFKKVDAIMFHAKYNEYSQSQESTGITDPLLQAEMMDVVQILEFKGKGDTRNMDKLLYNEYQKNVNQSLQSCIIS